MNKYLIIALFFMTTNIFAKPIITVTKVMGTATVLQPHSHQAIPVTLNQELEEDSSILTQEKSMVQVKYPDGSIVNLGPSSKIVIELIKNQNQPSFIVLLKGMLRAKVTKDEQKELTTKTKEKFIVKSNQAALGVRGTEFQFGISEDQSSTSLLTFEGTVEFSNKAITKKEIQENKETSIVKGELVKKGQFSNVKEDLLQKTKVLEPIEIDKNQFAILAKNDILQEVNSTKKEAYNTNNPVIDFQSGKIIKDKNVKIDESGNIIDERMNKMELNEVVLIKHDTNISIDHSLKFYQVQNNGNTYYLHDNSQTIQFESKTDFGYLSGGISFLANPKMSHSKYLSNVNNIQFSNDTLLSLKVLSNQLNTTFGNYQVGLGLSPKTYFKFDSMNNLANSTESSPNLIFNIYFDHNNNITSFVKSNASLVDMDKLGFDSSVGVIKKINSLNLGLSVDLEKIKKQTSEALKLSLGFDF